LSWPDAPAAPARGSSSEQQANRIKILDFVFIALGPSGNMIADD
jgi:hypothetical protein